MKGTFQTFVQNQPAPGEAGDFAGVNPRTSVNAPPGGYAADSFGVIVGHFAYGDPATGLAHNALTANALQGFVPRNQQSGTLITTFLDGTTLSVVQGYPVTLYNQGDFWAYFPTGAAVGAPVYALNTDGTPQTSSAAATLTPFTVVSVVDAPSVFTASIAAPSPPSVDVSIMHVTAFTSGPPLSAGQLLSGTGVVANTRIVSQVSGTPGGVGFYVVSEQAAVASTTITATGGQMGKISTWQTA